MEEGRGTAAQGSVAPFIVDLRHPLDYLPAPRVLPGALRIGPNELKLHSDIIPRDRDFILDCTCPSEETTPSSPCSCTSSAYIASAHFAVASTPGNRPATPSTTTWKTGPHLPLPSNSTSPTPSNHLVVSIDRPQPPVILSEVLRSLIAQDVAEGPRR